MGIHYKIKRKLVKFRNDKTKKFSDNLKSLITPEQLSLYRMVEDVAIKNNSNIVFDPFSSEIIISLPNILIILEGPIITVHNTNGFYSTEMNPTATTKLVDIIQREAHKERRKFKYQAKLRLQKFLVELNKEINE